MGWHIMQDGVSVGVYEMPPPLMDGQVAVEAPSPASAWVPVPDGDGGFVLEPAPSPPPVVPQIVTPLQMRKAIRQAGLKPLVDGFIAQIEGTDEGDAAIEAWEYAVEIVRADPFIAMAVAGMEWTDEQADALFILAASL